MSSDKPFKIGTVYSNGEYDLHHEYIDISLPTTLRLRQSRKTKNERRKFRERKVSLHTRKKVYTGEDDEKTQEVGVGEFRGD